jgi:hypothetical protein
VIGAQDRYDNTMQAYPTPLGRFDPARLGGARGVRALHWSLAALATLGLLLSLILVVQNIVRQAGLRHAATAAQADALWRCNSLPGRDARDDCRRVASSETPLKAN